MPKATEDLLAAIDRFARSLPPAELAAFAELLDRRAHWVRTLANASHLRKDMHSGPEATKQHCQRRYC